MNPSRIIIPALAAVTITATAAVALAGQGTGLQVSPRAVLTNGTTQVSVAGDLLCNTDPAQVAVTFGTVPAAPPRQGPEGCEVYVTAPAQAAGAVDLTVTVPGQPAAVMAKEVTYVDPPAVLVKRAKRTMLDNKKVWAMKFRAVTASDYVVSAIRPSGARLGMLPNTIIGPNILYTKQTSLTIRNIKAGEVIDVWLRLGRGAPAGTRLQVSSKALAPGIIPMVSFPVIP
ncbi:MAG: IPT/TIG domain-containing protein [Actinomycetota bacterium]